MSRVFQVTYVFAHQQTGGNFAKHPSGMNFKTWALAKFEIVTKALELLSKGAIDKVFVAHDLVDVAYSGVVADVAAVDGVPVVADADVGL